MHVNFTCVNLEAMYEVSRVNIKVEPRSTFRFTHNTSFIASILSTQVSFARSYFERALVLLDDNVGK